jgi:hypothetical protein
LLVSIERYVMAREIRDWVLDQIEKLNPKWRCTNMINKQGTLAIHICSKYGKVRQVRVAPVTNGEIKYLSAQWVPLNEKVMGPTWKQIILCENWAQAMNVLDKAREEMLPHHHARGRSYG